MTTITTTGERGFCCGEHDKKGSIRPITGVLPNRQTWQHGLIDVVVGFFKILLSRVRSIVQCIPRWLPASPAEAKALPREGASTLVNVGVFTTLWVVCR
jgi:hypothetical protein